MMENQIARIESALNRFVPETNELYKTVTDAMRYSLLNGGKRVRAVLTLEFCKLCGGTEEMAMPFACAVEMIHAYSLIHDDLPCMDNDDMRRGKPSNHKVFGENYALLAGDGLLTKAFETALSAEAFRVAGVERAAKAASVLAACAGEFGMVGGQCIDLETENQAVSLDVLYAKDTGKTANLIMAACMMGCIAAGAEDKLVEAARNYALHIGLAFQIRDDILDVTGTAEELGKNIGIDAQNNRCTYVSLLGIEKAQQMVDTYTNTALEALAVFSGDTVFLRDFALQLANRTK
ncbi:MAG: polyprenyl synthetase family protein [Clostridia bacterium]|nr:polyprenyl synthetase family protein [Clostridia bacterium]